MTDQGSAPVRMSSSKSEHGRVDRLSGYAWLTVFLPALLYFVATRTVFSTHRGGVGRRYDVASDTVRPIRIVGDDGRAASKKALGEIFHLTKSSSSSSSSSPSPSSASSSLLSLSYPLETVLSGPPSGPHPNPLLSVTSLLWVHDPELGRGYLLLSDSALSGRIWRWEVGGGPITIGRSLHMEWSGCRSNGGGGGRGRELQRERRRGGGEECPDNKHSFAAAAAEDDADGGSSEGSDSNGALRDAVKMLGSAGLAVQFDKGSEHSRTGALLVLERGERRLVRIEEDGARTPLALDVPVPKRECAKKGQGQGDDGEDGESTECQTRGEEEKVRMGGNGFVTYTPFGDVVFSDAPSFPSTSGTTKPFVGVYRLKEAVNVPSVPSSLSLEAHYWNETRGALEEVELLYGGMESVTGLVPTRDAAEGVLVAGTLTDGRMAIVRLPLDDDDDDDSGDDNDREGQPTASASVSTGLVDSRARVVHDLSDLFASSETTFGANGSPALTIDSEGRLYASFPKGILVLSPSFERLGTIPLKGDSSVTGADITDLEIGEDRYLYASTATALMRVRVKAKMGTVKTDLVVPGRKKKA